MWGKIMARAKSLKIYYESKPTNCPMCGKRTVVDLLDDEKRLLQAGSEPRGAGGEPAWRCEACGAVLWQGSDVRAN